MATCGYICPQCNGTGFNDENNICDWCGPKTASTPKTTKNNKQLSKEEWIKHVHEGPCCSDLHEQKDKTSI